MDARIEIARAWDLFREGAFTEAARSLAPRTLDPEAAHVLLWIALRKGDTEAKRQHGAWLAEHANGALAAVGRAHENVALATSQLQIKSWLTSTSKWALSEIAYAQALIAFISDEAHAARDALAAALPQTSEQRVRYAQLRAWIVGRDDRFDRQITYLMHALALAIKERVDRGLIARIAESLAPLVRELELGELGDHAEELLSSVPWPRDATTYRFYTQRALAWRHAVRGDWIRATGLLDATVALAPDNVRRALLFADRSRVSHAVGESVSALSACANALECFSDIDWTSDLRDEATMVFGAMDVLRSDRERAQLLFERAAAAQTSKMSGMGHGRRLAAFKSFALSHLTDGDEALQHAHDAYKAFKEMKYVHRATSCALRAVELGGGARWRSRVERLIAPYPRSLEARQYEQMNSPLNRIQGRKREVAQLLATSNKTAREIGEALGMAEGTVRVHIKHINRILHTENRAQLVRLVMGATDAA